MLKKVQIISNYNVGNFVFYYKNNNNESIEKK